MFRFRAYFIAFRKCLDRNKVFFETISATLLGVMALCLILQSNRISKYQAQLAKSQIELSQQLADRDMTTHLPEFHLSMKHVVEEPIGHCIEDRILIYNEGAPLYDLDPRFIVFIKVETGMLGEQRTAFVPIHGYYFNLFRTGKATGLVATIAGDRNRVGLYELDQAFSAYAKAKGDIGFISIERFIRIRYQDKFGSSNEAFFSIDAFRHKKLADEDGIRWFEQHRSGWLSDGTAFEYREVSPEALYGAWEKLIKKGNIPTSSKSLVH